MKKLHPSISTYEEGIKFLSTAKNVKFYYFNPGYDNFVLSGSPTPNRLKISLIRNINEDGIIFRLVINDEGCKTIYCTSDREFLNMLKEITYIAKKNNQKLKLLYNTKEDINTLIDAVERHGFTSSSYILDKTRVM